MFNVLHCFTFVQCLICILFSPAWSPTVGTVFIEFVVSLYVEVTSAKWFNVLGLGFKKEITQVFCYCSSSISYSDRINAQTNETYLSCVIQVSSLLIDLPH